MSHLPPLISDLALILGAAAVVSLLFKRLKQPVVLGYIIAGLLVGPNFKLFPTVVEVDSIRTWAEIGVIILLFSLGLEFSFKKLIKVGGVAVIAALFGIGFTLLLGFSAAHAMGWNRMDSLFLGGILAIASTTIIIRAFDELQVKTQKFASIVLGVLIIEDLVAVVLMVMLSTVAVSRSFEGTEMLVSVLKLAFFLVLWFVSGIFFLPTLLKKIKGLMNEETLLIVALSLCFFMVYLATVAGFSAALGAFIMGSILAETTKAEKIEHIISPIKSLFGAIFFVSVGMLIDPTMLAEYAGPILIATLILLLGKPTFVLLGALAAGQPLRIAVQTGMSLSQIGEFSFIIASLGLSLGVTSDFLYPVAVAVSVLTTFSTPFMIRLSEPMYRLIERKLPRTWSQRLDAYSIGANEVKDDSDWKVLLRFYLMNTLVFSVIILTIILLSTQTLAPIVAAAEWSKWVTAIITLIVLTPFLWALAFRRSEHTAYANVWMNSYQRGPLAILMLSRLLLSVFFIGLLLNLLFDPKTALIGAIAASVLLIPFYGRIRNFYSRIELRFMNNLNERERQAKESRHALTPWDTHLATFRLGAYSPFVGKTLLESRIREDFGVNVAAIERGDMLINVPSRTDRLYPQDVLSVIGTDEQMNRFRSFLEQTDHPDQYFGKRHEVSLQSFIVDPHSILVGESIRSSGIREQTQGLVVGVERGTQRIVNPESDWVFHGGDRLYIVGNAKRIHVLARERKASGQ